MALQVIVPLATFIGTSALVGGLSLLLRKNTSDREIEARLGDWTGIANNRINRANAAVVTSQPLKGVAVAIEESLSRIIDVKSFLQQADVNLTSISFLALTAALFLAGCLTGFIPGMSWSFVPVIAILLASIPFGYVAFRRSKRKKQFAKQLPESLELIARSLRAGHSLSAGFQLIGMEMNEPIAGEFRRCYEEQHLGISLEESLDGLANRVPNLDLRFFATAVILQRTTGGDLAELLDKIALLVRERFAIRGKVQALTGEGRLSGIILLSLPPVLFLVMLRLNYDYSKVLFTDPMGKQMLAFGVAMQLVGALVIRKIVNIRV